MNPEEFFKRHPSIKEIDCRIAHGGYEIEEGTGKRIQRPHWILVPGDIIDETQVDKAVLKRIVEKMRKRTVGHPMLGLDKDRTWGYQLAVSDLENELGLGDEE